MSSIEFAEAARRLGQASRALGHDVPSFRSPPRRPGLQRSIRWRTTGGRATNLPASAATVSVRLAKRPFAAVVADMVDGIVAANRLEGAAAGALRDALWESAADLLVPAAPAIAEVRSITQAA